MNKWIIFQIGSRENYSIAEVLEQDGKLLSLVTDIWINPKDKFSSIAFKIFPRATSRYNPNLPDKRVKSFNLLCILIFLVNKILPKAISFNYDLICQNLFAYHLKKYTWCKPIIFSYNYSAYLIFREARKMGLKTVLGQIDAGPEAGRINRDLYMKACGDRIKPNDYYLSYRLKWNKECDWASSIIVNSEWSKDLLIKAGVDIEKIHVVKLVYNPPIEANSFQRTYPKQFDEKRPLQILFLGSLKIMKGILPLIEAARRTVHLPIKFICVGLLKMPEFLLKDIPSNMMIVKGVTKAQTINYYKSSDVFILPTYSDGFAITQLEAQAWKLPIISTSYCGKVVENGVNGWILEAIDHESIIKIIKVMLDNPSVLNQYSNQSLALQEFSLDNLKSSLINLTI